jgi:hypothetical protein
MRCAIRFLAFALAVSVLVSIGAAQENADKGGESSDQKTWVGYLVDRNCGIQIEKKQEERAMTMAKKHSVACGLDEVCMASGYGIIKGGKFYKFDDAGDGMAAEYLKKLNKKNDVLVSVSGTLDGSVLRVSAIKDEKRTKTEKKS